MGGGAQEEVNRGPQFCVGSTFFFNSFAIFGGGFLGRRILSKCRRKENCCSECSVLESVVNRCSDACGESIANSSSSSFKKFLALYESNEEQLGTVKSKWKNFADVHPFRRVAGEQERATTSTSSTSIPRGNPAIPINELFHQETTNLHQTYRPEKNPKTRLIALPETFFHVSVLREPSCLTTRHSIMPPTRRRPRPLTTRVSRRATVAGRAVACTSPRRPRRLSPARRTVGGSYARGGILVVQKFISELLS